LVHDGNQFLKGSVPDYFRSLQKKADELIENKPRRSVSTMLSPESLLARMPKAAQDRLESALNEIGSAPYLLAHLGIATIAQLDAGVDTTYMSARDYYRQDEDELILVKQGLGTLVSHFAESIKVFSGVLVRRVTANGRRSVTLTTSKGSIRARAAIITVPPAILAESAPEQSAISFSPMLPKKFRNAINNLPMGHLNKIGIKFQPNALRGIKAFTELNALTKVGIPMYALLRPWNRPLATVFVGGEHSRLLEALGKGAMKDFALQAMEGVFGADLRKQVVKIHVTRWGADPFACGAYSAERPECPDARDTLGSHPAHDCIFFAGEATDLKWATRLNGAFRSGHRVANKVDRFLAGRNSPFRR
jgi:monoamine oxidase